MGYNYSKKDIEKDHMAVAVGRALSISHKASIELCNNLRGKSTAKAKRILSDVISLSVPVKFSRFTNGAGHKKGKGPGKFPQKAATEILKLIETCEANAQFKGLNTSNLIINHISAQNAGNQWRYGRVRRRRMKRTTIEVVVEEGKKKSAEKNAGKEESKKENTAVKKEETKKPVEKKKEEIKNDEVKKTNPEKKSESKESNKPKEESGTGKSEAVKEDKK